MAMPADHYVLALLGQQPADNDNEWAARDAVRAGLPFAAFERIRDALAIPQGELARVLVIPPRTLDRRRSESGVFHPDESDRLYRMARTTALAAQVLGSNDKAREWLKESNPALGGETPLALLDTDDGHQRVREVLTRLQFGIYS